MAFRISQVPEVTSDLAKLAKRDARRFTKVARCLARLADDPTYPGLGSHHYETFFVNGAQVWESYVENNTPSAWRVWWVYGPEPGEITVVAVGPHP